jgi:hypothetical protein
VSDQRHTNVRTNACEDVPPAMKFKDESPREANILLEGGYMAAKMEVDAPEEVPKKEACWEM